MGIFTSILGAVVPKLVGGLFSSNSQKKQNAANQAAHRERFVDTVADAQRAGINPLTALRTSGAQSYQAPILQSSSFIGEALSAGIQTGFNFEQTQRDQERDNLERDIMKAQLDQLQKANKVRGGEYFGYGIPNAQVTSQVTGPLSRPSQVGNPLGSGSGSDALGYRTSIYAGTDVPPANMSDAELVEQRYGDGPVSWIYGTAVAAADGINAAGAYLPTSKANEYRNLFNDWVDKQAAAAWKRINAPIPPRLSPSTNPRRPKTFNSRAY